MSISVSGSQITFNDASVQNTAATGFGFKNRILNGSMMIDQRNAGASVTPANADFIVDRFQYVASQASKVTAQQNAGSVTPPAGFTKYLGITSSSAYSIGATDFFNVSHKIEGFNTADLGWGTANAATVTLSFWVRSSLTGTFGGTILNNAQNRYYPFSYTISAANTWEQKTITIAGDTSGTWATDNSIGMRIMFGLGVGSTYSGTAGSWTTSNLFSVTGATSVVGTNGATFYITGVQLEKGSTATSFDYRPYGTELQLCQRYYNMIRSDTSAYGYFGGGKAYDVSTCQIQIPLYTEMRTVPTSIDIPAVSNFMLETGATTITALSTIAMQASTSTRRYLWLNLTKTSAFTAGATYVLLANNNTNCYIGCSAEL